MLESVPALEEYLISLSLEVVIAASVIIAAATVVAFFYKKRGGRTKLALFLAIVIPSVATMAFISVGTVYLNVISETGGPIHWHADFEIWKCGQKLDLIDPTGIENRIGTPLLHEHGDDRVHVEGTVLRGSEISLKRFFEMIGGFMSDSELSIPTNDGVVDMKTGDTCDGKEAKLQVFVYKTTNPDELKNWVFVQEKVEDFENYVMSPYSTIPPGDCIIIELDEDKDRTERICETTRISVSRGESSGS